MKLYHLGDPSRNLTVSVFPGTPKVGAASAPAADTPSPTELSRRSPDRMSRLLLE